MAISLLRNTTAQQAPFLTDYLTLEELLDLVQPGLRAGIVPRVVLLADRLELAQQLALALGQADRGLHHHVAEEIAGCLAAHALDALRFQAERLSALGFS